MTISDILGELARGLPITALLTVAGFVVGAVSAVPVAAARASSITAVKTLAVAYIEIARGIPPIVWLFLLYFGLNQFGIQLESIAAAILGLGIISAAYLSEIYRSGLASVPAGQLEAAQALSLSRMTAFVRVTLPQAIVTIVPLATAFFIGLLKDSAIASVIGVQEITTAALSLSRRTFDGLTIFVLCGLVYLVISLPISVLGRWLGNRLAQQWTVAR
ncbi:amino acid ABC transporter permease [Rhodococcus sp. NBC_00294]|uniref:amino acid ABC transporter permease n=1 Tax=Rhodococcus sp. NBC_00294 TaxID=2976004 RepID=UPI002E2CC684|nr:amino acid ABC transporter permease [Rhodococcus sp. NBC_00294]